MLPSRGQQTRCTACYGVSRRQGLIQHEMMGGVRDLFHFAQSGGMRAQTGYITLAHRDRPLSVNHHERTP